MPWKQFCIYCKSYWYFFSPLYYEEYMGEGRKDYWGGHCENTQALFARATTEKKERKKGILKWNSNWGEEANTFLFFSFSFSFILLLNQTDVVINLHSAAQLMWQSTKLIPLCKIQFTSGFSFSFFFFAKLCQFSHKLERPCQFSLLYIDTTQCCMSIFL